MIPARKKLAVEAFAPGDVEAATTWRGELVVEQGQPLGEVRHPDGTVLAEVTAARAGRVPCLRTLPRVFTGNMLAYVLALPDRAPWSGPSIPRGEDPPPAGRGSGPPRTPRRRTARRGAAGRPSPSACRR